VPPLAGHQVVALCPYCTMFPLDFPLRQMQLFPEAKRVLDPFCSLKMASLTGGC
jgi:hypothetical protein